MNVKLGIITDIDNEHDARLFIFLQSFKSFDGFFAE